MTVTHLAVKHLHIPYYARIYMVCPRGIAVLAVLSVMLHSCAHARLRLLWGLTHQVKTHPGVLWPLSEPGKEIHGATMSKHNGRESDPAVAENLDRTAQLFTLLCGARSNLLCTLWPIRCHQQVTTHHTVSVRTSTMTHAQGRKMCAATNTIMFLIKQLICWN